MAKYQTKMEQRRKELNMTQMELAYRAKVGFADISRFENCWARPYNGQAARLSEVLGIPADELTKEAS